MNQAARVDANELQAFATQCFERAGASAPVAQAMAQSLLAGDLLGFPTHGLRRLPYNVKQLSTGAMKGEGEPEVLSQRSAVACWDAHKLPGLYVMPQAVAAACKMARQAGTGTIVVRRAEHVASLAAYLEQATAQGLVISMMCATPAQASVAPFGGTERLFSPNPFAIGVPATKGALLLDMSFSVTAAGKVRQAYERGEMLQFDAIVLPNGRISRDPKDYIEQGGALLPLGGADLGYKGFGLCLMSEVWTMALSNYGRVEGADDGECNSVFIQVMDPAAFGDVAAFRDVTDDLLRRCRDNTPREVNQPVRVPGERALALKQQQLIEGVWLDAQTWPRLVSCAERLGIEPPTALELS
ncbi:MAG: Ldh family oxidoreductase [Idiomarina sp.]|nr:Ldh family oxidoreductase [Idiomarina sp.]